jgi:tRNA dimethylallyltransferase
LFPRKMSQTDAEFNPALGSGAKEMDMLDAFGLADIPADQPVLIAGPTASGKSALALAIARHTGGVIVNADASQIYQCWRVITACPSAQEEVQAPHALYRHVPYDAPYSAGHWLREISPFLGGSARPIIVGGTGLYFSALTNGLADIPATPPEVRNLADTLSLGHMLAALDSATCARIDVQNRARVQRAFEVQTATGTPLAVWQDATPAPLVDTANATCIVMDAPKDWLNARIAQRFDLMIDAGAMDEITAMQDHYDPALPSCRAIGVPELMAHANGDLSLTAAREAAVIATRQYAKRQRTWFRSKMKDWIKVNPSTLA